MHLDCLSYWFYIFNLLKINYKQLSNSYPYDHLIENCKTFADPSFILVIVTTAHILLLLTYARFYLNENIFNSASL